MALSKQKLEETLQQIERFFEENNVRKIEAMMLDAAFHLRPFSSGNTQVSPRANAPAADIYLHGNHIATYYKGGSADPEGNYYSTDTAVPNQETLAKWPTKTTKSRLHALGVEI